MTKKAKTGIGALVVASFVLGGFIFNAYERTDAAEGNGFFNNGHRAGFAMRGRGPMVGAEGQDWKNMTDEERQQKTEEKKAETEAWKNMTPEERRAKMAELKANGETRGEKMGFGFGLGHFFGLTGPNSGKVNYEATNIENGVEVTITSDDSAMVQKLQEMAAKLNGKSQTQGAE